MCAAQRSARASGVRCDDDRGVGASGALLGGAGLLCLSAVTALVPAIDATMLFFGLRVEAGSLPLAVAAAAAMVLLLATARRAPVTGVTAMTAVLLAAASAAAVVPVVEGVSTAAAHRVSPTLGSYLAPAPHGRPNETVTYTSDGLQLDVWYPPVPAPDRPAVVLVHGGGWASGSRGASPWWPAWFVERGYVVVDVDYRLAPPPRWRDAPGDVKCAVGWLAANASRYGVDVERIGLLGHSAGGHLALLAAYSVGDERLPPSCPVAEIPVAAVAAFYPITDLAVLRRRPEPWFWNVASSELIPQYLGADPGAIPERAAVASPVGHVDAGDPPTYLVHGTADQVVPSTQSALLADRLRDAGVPGEFVRLPGGNHAYDEVWSGWHGVTTRVTLGRFLDDHLPAPPRERVTG